MKLRTYFPGVHWIYRTTTSRLARQVYLTLLIPLALAWTIPRMRSMLMTRKIHSVLAGMQKIRLDQTTERELLNTVPHLVRSPVDRRDGQSVQNFYSVEITNEPDWEWLLFRFSDPIREKLAKVLDWVGYRIFVLLPALSFWMERIRRGAGRYSWKGIRRSRLIPRPLAPSERILNPVPPPQKGGDQALFFGGDIFYSCRFVPASAATVGAVRRAIPAPKRWEDEVVMGLQ
jgi:hypothetical protein